MAAPTMKSLSDEGLHFLEKYFTETSFPLTRHHIDSYEHCVFDEIPTIIQSTNPLTFMKEPLNKEGTAFAYKVEVFIGGDRPTASDLALYIAPPVVTLDAANTVRRMLPNEARLRNLTYAAEIKADITIRVTFTTPVEGRPGEFSSRVQEAETIKEFPLFRLPILLRSRLCPTGVADPARLEEMGECRNDQGGYFIVGGAEKVLVTRGEQAFNTLYVEKKPDNDPKVGAYASVVSLHPETKQTRRVALYMMRETKHSREDCIRVSIPMVRGAFPLFILFRALGVETDEEIVDLIFPDKVADAQLRDQLMESIYDAYPIYNRYTAIRYIMTLTKGFTEAHVLDILQNLMLAHVPDEPLARAQYLADMAREMLRANAGLRLKNDRDDMRAQRYLTTGTLIRELFNGAWKDWRKAVVETVDRAYRSNEQLYQGNDVFNLFATANLLKVFQPQTLNTAIMRGFRGRWGTNEMNEKSGVLQPLARISYLDAMSHTRRVVTDFDTGMKTTGPRKLHTSQVGYFCTSETPTGAHIGVTKNMSIMTQFSFGVRMEPVYAWLKTRGGVIPVADTTAALRATTVTVQINGGTVGYTLDPIGLTRVLKLMKWNAFLPPTVSVSFNTTDKVLRIYLDEGRPLRPLWHLNSEGTAFLERLSALSGMVWRDLVFGTHTGTTERNIRSTTFVDPLADTEAPTFDDYVAELSDTAGFIEYCDPTEMNDNYISWWGNEELTPAHTHAEIHPSTLTGLLTSMIPYANHNQSPRNQLSCSQSKQGIGYMATNFQNRYDTYSHQLCYGEAPLCRTMYYENIAGGQMPYGFNCIIAVTSETGYNQDDGLIMNRDSVARGMFQNLAFRTYDCEEETDPITKTHTHVANPAAVPTWTALRPGLDYSRLDERGIIREGEYVDDSTVLVGRYMVVPTTHEVKDVSVTPNVFTQGRVESVVVLHQGDGTLLVKVRLIEMRVPGLGDKFSSRHGQKGTIGMLVASENLPRTAEGVVPDVMVNPGGLISRMTVAQLIEMVGGRAAAEMCAKFNATTFSNGKEYVTQLGDTLQQLGCSRTGDAVLYSGITGKQIRTDIFMCPLYFMRLKHLTEDKVNARGVGRREVRTHQPTGGRGNEGGLRIGEMERDALCAHGVSGFLQESMMKRADATSFWICNGCGRVPIYNEEEGLFVCPSCDGPLTFTGASADTLTLQLPLKQSRVTFTRIEIPYTLKLIDQEMTSMMGAGFRFVTGGTISRLRDSGWEWKQPEVVFEAGVRDVAAATEVNPFDGEAGEEEEESEEGAGAGRVIVRAPQEKVGAAPVVNLELPALEQTLQKINTDIRRYEQRQGKKAPDTLYRRRDEYEMAVTIVGSLPGASTETLNAQLAALRTAMKTYPVMNKRVPPLYEQLEKELLGRLGVAEAVTAPVETTTAAALAPVEFSPRIPNEFVGFSNFATSPFRISGKQIPGPTGREYPEIGVEADGTVNVARQTWPTVEHYYQAMKFPEDPEWQAAIRQAATATKAKKLGLSSEHTVRADWEAVKETVMKMALLAKFRQNPALLRLLKETGDRPLIDASTGDKYWGAGPKGDGLNRLGALLAEVRAELRDFTAGANTVPALGVGEVLEQPDDNLAVNDMAENIMSSTSQIVNAATGGIVSMGNTAAAAPTQQGGGVGGSQGVFFIINSNMGGQSEQAHRQRERRASKGRISWAELGVSQEGGDANTSSDDGGDGAQLITVEKVE